MTPMTLSDQQLRELVAPPAEIVAPNGLLLDIADSVRRQPQVRSWLGSPWDRDLGSQFGDARSGRLAWGLIVVGMVAILAVGAVVGGRIVLRVPSERPATGIETLTHGPSSYDQVIRDGRGQLWAFGAGHLTRFALDIAPERDWTISDDPAFAAQVVAGAIDGGVWLWNGDVIRRFDGTAFRESVPAPSEAGAAALADRPEGALNATTADGVAWQWDGSAWSRRTTGGPSLGWPVLMVDADETWVGEWQPGGDGYRALWHLSGSTWTVYGPDVLPLLRGCCLTVAASPDGAVWAASEHEVARLADGRWTDMGDPGFDTVALGWDGQGSMLAMSVDPDLGARWVGARWEPFVPMPGAPLGEVIRLMSDRDGLFLGTTSGIYHLADGGWRAAWPITADGPASRHVSHAWFGHQILATGPDEAWIAGNGGPLWHFLAGRWELPSQPWSSGTLIRAIRRLPDGSLVLATDIGVVVEDGDTWVTAVPGNVWDVAPADDGSIWAAADPGVVRHLVRSEEGWKAVDVDPCPNSARSIAIDREGAVWLGGITYSGTGGIARLDASGCQRVRPLGDPGWLEVMDIEAHPDGGVVIVIGRALPQVGTAETEPMWDWAVVRSDGTASTTLLAPEPDIGWNGDVSVGPDGSVWVGRDGLRRYHDGEWQLIAADITSQAIGIARDGTAFFVGPSGLQRIRADALPD